MRKNDPNDDDPDEIGRSVAREIIETGRLPPWLDESTLLEGDERFQRRYLNATFVEEFFRLFLPVPTKEDDLGDSMASFGYSGSYQDFCSQKDDIYRLYGKNPYRPQHLVHMEKFNEVRNSKSCPARRREIQELLRRLDLGTTPKRDERIQHMKCQLFESILHQNLIMDDLPTRKGICASEMPKATIDDFVSPGDTFKGVIFHLSDSPRPICYGGLLDPNPRRRQPDPPRPNLRKDRFFPGIQTPKKLIKALFDGRPYLGPEVKIEQDISDDTERIFASPWIKEADIVYGKVAGKSNQGCLAEMVTITLPYNNFWGLDLCEIGFDTGELEPSQARIIERSSIAGVGGCREWWSSPKFLRCYKSDFNIRIDTQGVDFSGFHTLKVGNGAHYDKMRYGHDAHDAFQGIILDTHLEFLAAKGLAMKIKEWKSFLTSVPRRLSTGLERKSKDGAKRVEKQIETWDRQLITIEDSLRRRWENRQPYSSDELANYLGLRVMIATACEFADALECTPFLGH